MLKKVIISLAFIVLFAVFSMAADLITGRWDGAISTPYGDIGLTYHLKAEGEKLSGNIVLDQGEFVIYDGKVAGENISFKILFNDLVITHEGKVVDDTLKIKLKIQDNVIEGKLLRAKIFIDDKPRIYFR